MASVPNDGWGPMDPLATALTIRPWREYDYLQSLVKPPFAHWEETYTWALPSRPGFTFSYYKTNGTYGKEEWIILWNETLGTGKPVAVWRIM